MTDERAIEDRIRARAHEIWESEGQPEGEELRHWDEARLEIEAEEHAASEAGTADDTVGAAALAEPMSEAAGGSDLPPEAGQDGRDADGGVETEASPSQLERAPM